MILWWNKLKLFLIINYLFFINWLEIYFSWWSLIIFSNCFFSIFNWFYNLWMIYNLRFRFLNIKNLLNNMFLWLDISFSNSGSSRNSNRNTSSNNLLINNRFVLNIFSINRSVNSSFFNNWCLYNFLFDDRLCYNFFGYDWLTNYLSFNNWLGYQFLWLIYHWFCI